MWYPEKIKSIKETDRVLEIGPGGTPYSRSDVFLELIIKDEKEFRKQRGDMPPLVTTKPVVYYDGTKFPFKNKEFDYVICSHVLEHVPNLESFLKELFRIARNGYIEYPTIYYEYIYNFSVHKNLLKYNQGSLLYLPKNETHLEDFQIIQNFYQETLSKDYYDLVNQLRPFMAEGFEWHKPFKLKQTQSITDLSWVKPQIPEMDVQRKATLPGKMLLALNKSIRAYFKRKI